MTVGQNRSDKPVAQWSVGPSVGRSLAGPLAITIGAFPLRFCVLVSDLTGQAARQRDRLAKSQRRDRVCDEAVMNL